MSLKITSKIYQELPFRTPFFDHIFKFWVPTRMEVEHIEGVRTLGLEDKQREETCCVFVFPGLFFQQDAPSGSCFQKDVPSGFFFH